MGHSFLPLCPCREAAGASPEGLSEERQHGKPRQPTAQEEQRHGPDKVEAPATPPGSRPPAAVSAHPQPLPLPSLLRPSSSLKGSQLPLNPGWGVWRKGCAGAQLNSWPGLCGPLVNPVSQILHPRLVVPNKGYSSLDQSPDEKPLVALDTDRCVWGLWDSQADPWEPTEHTNGLDRPYPLDCEDWGVPQTASSSPWAKIQGMFYL